MASMGVAQPPINSQLHSHLVSPGAPVSRGRSGDALAFSGVLAEKRGALGEHKFVRLRNVGGWRSSSQQSAKSSPLKPGLEVVASAMPAGGEYYSEKPATPLVDTINDPLHMKNLSVEDINLEMDDEQLDELFETYGEVFKGELESAPASSEVDEDAKSLAFAVALAEVANEVKAGEIQVLFVKPLVYWTRFFVIATGFSRPQVDAIGKKMRDMAEERFQRRARGDLKPNAWTLLDFEDIVVHIFYPKERSFYNLEEFYANATPVKLPFSSQS